MTDRPILTIASVASPADMAGGLLGFSERLMRAETTDEIFDALQAFATAERIGELMLELRAPIGDAPERWTAIPPARIESYDDSRVMRLLEEYLPARGRPAAIAWSTSAHPGLQRVGDSATRARLLDAGVAGGILAGMVLPSGRIASAQVLVGPDRVAVLPEISRDLFLVAAIHAFLTLDRCLGPIPPKDLTRRELEALRLSARGLRTRAIAETMNIAEATVKFHLVGARRKLNASTTREAAAALIEHRL
jgi:DNA-binding CsgD family transcriptional regulator